MVDGGSLENCWAATSRGFESLTLRFKASASQALFAYREGFEPISPFTLPSPQTPLLGRGALLRDTLMMLGDQKGIALLKTDVFQHIIDQAMEGLTQ